MKTDELKGRLQAVLTEARDISAKCEAESRDFTDAERDTVTAKMKEATDLGNQIKKAQGDDELRKSIADFGDQIGLVDSAAEAKSRREQVGNSGLVVPGRKSVGELFTESKQYADLLSTAPNGQFAKDMRVQSNPVGFKALVTGVSDTSAGALVDSDRRGLLVGPDQFFRPLSLRDLVTPGTTTSDQIEYARVTGFSNNAAPVAEATSSAAPTAPGTAGALVNAPGGGYKPESGFSTVRVTTPVKTIAHWMPATKRSLSDAAQIRTLIDNFLQVGLEEELEDQMISGDNTGENFEGLATVSGTQTQAFVADPADKPAGFGKLLGLRRAKTKVRTVGRSVANGYVIHPNDLETLDEISNMDGNFYFGGPSGANGTAPLWGLPVIESEAVTPGKAWVGDWRKAILWDREQASVTITDSHADFFVRNLVAILAEMRAAFGVIQPSAFVEVDLVGP